MNEMGDRTNAKFWQRGYYEHIIRDGQELDQIPKYIFDNAVKWELDDYYSAVRNLVM